MAKGNAIKAPQRNATTRVGVKIIHDTLTRMCSISPPSFPFSELGTLGDSISEYRGFQTTTSYSGTTGSGATAPGGKPKAKMKEETRLKLSAASSARWKAKKEAELAAAEAKAEPITKTARKRNKPEKAMTAGQG